MSAQDPRDYRFDRKRWDGIDPASPLAHAADALEHAINNRQIRHGDLPRWQAALAALPQDIEASLQCEDGTVTVGAAHANTTAHKESSIRDALMQLCPWRKGPFCISGIPIDTEWRSDWKWDRVLPVLSSLRGRHVLDVGCGSGYHLWRMHEAGAASVLGIEPMLLYQHQFDVVQHFAQEPSVQCLPLALEHLPANMPGFDTVFSMGVLYHARDPHQHLRELREQLRPGGECVLETLVLDDANSDDELIIEDRYARMRNMHCLPGPQRVTRWLEESGFSDIRLVHLARTSVTEQRRTQWMPFDSLAESLDPSDPAQTVEGLPAPCRAVFIALRAS